MTASFPENRYCRYSPNQHQEEHDDDDDDDYDDDDDESKYHYETNEGSFATTATV